MKDRRISALNLVCLLDKKAKEQQFLDTHVNFLSLLTERKIFVGISVKRMTVRNKKKVKKCKGKA